MTCVTIGLKRDRSSSDWHSPPRIYILLAIVQSSDLRHIPRESGYHGKMAATKQYIAATSRDCLYCVNLASCTNVSKGL
ncbi:hypothetical protein [Microcoleus sp. BROC3]|uniref:hypothetical protein n=1 Tax=Microcoleus sp. BROC3 TaxID=3055323 RepID=UPI002FD645A2